MKIAICDDQKDLAELFFQKIQIEEPESELSIFTSGNDLLNAGNLWDIVFLDIEMDEMDGFFVAKELNTRQPGCIFSFVISHAELAVDGYDYQPFRYIVKTAPEPVINRKIRETIGEYYHRNKVLKVAYKGNCCNVSVSDILWVEIQGYCMKLILEDRSILWGKSLRELEEDLTDYGLTCCHRSFIVSLSQVKEFTLKTVLLKNVQTIPVGRAYRKNLIEKHQKFMPANSRGRNNVSF